MVIINSICVQDKEKMMTKKLINRILLLVVLAIVALALWQIFIYTVPPELPTYVERQYDGELVKELGYVPGQILIQLKEDEIDLSTNIGMRRFLKFLNKKSAELAPIMVTELKNSGKLLESDISEGQLNDLKDTLITYGDSSGSNGALLSLAIDDAIWGVITELEKEGIVENVSPNYLGNVPKSRLNVLPTDSEKRCPGLREYKESDGAKVVNCFPGEPPVFCHPDYRSWITDNCPNFSFSS